MSLLLEDRPAPPPRRLPKPVGLLVLVVLVLVLLGGAVTGGRAVLAAFSGNADYSGTGAGAAVVQVHEGDTARNIGATLVSKQVVKSAGAFADASSAEPRSRSLQPGFYQLREHMSARSALALLLEPTSRLRGRVTVPEGAPLAKVVDRLTKGTEVRRADLAAALARPSTLGLPTYAMGEPEGFLFPATYDVEPGTKAVDVLRLMTARFSIEAAALDLELAAKAQQRSAYDIVTVASLVEAETPLDADRAKVARVVYNRLAMGMPLQLDSTVNYVRTERAARLSNADIAVASPYNTYLHKGLPPTPIDSPGRAALKAALHPAAGNYIFFITIDKQGHSLFTASYPQFLTAKAKAQRDGVY